MRMNRTGRILAAVCLLGAAGTPAAAEAPVVELVTMLPGEEVWSRFGHSALLVETDGQERVYSFGHATFQRLSFAVDYLMGRSRFHIERWTWDRTLRVYAKRDRTVIRQRLNLEPAQARLVLSNLEHAMLPENRAYVYDQLRINCATKLRDILDAATGGALARGAAFLPEGRGRTYRAHTLEALGGAWFSQGIVDLLAGGNHERVAADYDLGYLPRYLMDMVAVSTNTVGGQALPLAAPPRLAYLRRGPPLAGAWYGARLFAVAGGLAAGLALFFLVRAGGREERRCGPRLAGYAGGWFLAVFAILATVCGCVFLANFLFSGDADYGSNWNFLVLVAADFLLLPVAWRLVRGRAPVVRRFQRLYLDARLAVLAVLILTRVPGLFPQDNPAFAAATGMLLLGLRLGAAARFTRNAGA